MIATRSAPFRVAIELAGPPRGKGRPRATVLHGHARVYTDAKTASYEAQLRFAGQQAMQGRAPFDGPVRVEMTARFAIPASWSKKKREAALAGGILPTVTPDLDNTLKLSDALNGIVWIDDKQIVEARLSKCYSDMPGLSIIVEDAVAIMWGNGRLLRWDGEPERVLPLVPKPRIRVRMARVVEPERDTEGAA